MTRPARPAMPVAKTHFHCLDQRPAAAKTTRRIPAPARITP
jgi:hypothetical protein